MTSGWSRCRCAHSCQSRVGRAQVDVHHPVEQRRGHRSHDGAVLRAVAGADDDRALGQQVLADAPFVDQAVERLLHLLRAGVQLVEEQAVRLRRARSAPGGQKRLDAIDDLRHADRDPPARAGCRAATRRAGRPSRRTPAPARSCRCPAHPRRTPAAPARR